MFAKKPGWFGPFYYDKQNPKIFVRKRWGWGWTFNFARPVAVVIMAALLISPIAAVIIALTR